MATKNIVPRASGEGQLGTTAKPWGKIICNEITVVNGTSSDTVDAANITGGVVAPAHLGTGTPSSSTYLRGDNTWASVSAGSSTSVDAANITGGYIATSHLGSGTVSTSKFLRGDGTWATVSSASVDSTVISPTAVKIPHGGTTLTSAYYANDNQGAPQKILGTWYYDASHPNCTVLMSAGSGILFLKSDGTILDGIREDATWYHMDARVEHQYTSLSNNYTNWNASTSYAPVSQLDASGFIKLRGCVANASETAYGVVFYLNVNHRPARKIYVACPSSSGIMATVTIDTDGTVYVISGSTSFISFDNICFSRAS